MLTRRNFLAASTAAGVFSFTGLNARAQNPPTPKIAGFDETQTTFDETRPWEKYTDRKVRVALVGYGVCQFSVQFSLQNHPNAEVVAVSDLVPERCDQLSQVARCEKKYPSLAELLKDDSVEAVFLATDAPSHAQQAIQCLKAGKHVASAVPAVMGNLDDAYELYETVKAHPGNSSTRRASTTTTASVRSGPGTAGATGFRRSSTPRTRTGSTSA